MMGTDSNAGSLFSLSIYIIIRYRFPVLSKNAKTFCFSRKKFLKYLQGWKIVRTFASAFALKFGAEGKKERVLWKTYIDREEVVREAVRIYNIYVLGNKNKPFQFQFKYYRIERSETEKQRRNKNCTTLLAAREEKACFLFRVATQSVKIFCNA